MEFSPSEENQSFSLIKFESMLKTNNVLFFDSNEFENIIHHYLEIGKISLAKKAIKLGLDQHPTSVNLRLFRVEILIFENKLSEADKLLSTLFELEPNNEEIYIQKANIHSKRDQHNEAIEVFKSALTISNDSSEIQSLIGMEYLFLDNYENAKIRVKEAGIYTTTQYRVWRDRPKYIPYHPDRTYKNKGWKDGQSFLIVDHLIKLIGCLMRKQKNIFNSLI